MRGKEREATTSANMGGGKGGKLNEGNTGDQKAPPIGGWKCKYVPWRGGGEKKKDRRDDHGGLYLVRNMVARQLGLTVLRERKKGKITDKRGEKNGKRPHKGKRRKKKATKYGESQTLEKLAENSRRWGRKIQGRKEYRGSPVWGLGNMPGKKGGGGGDQG